MTLIKPWTPSNVKTTIEIWGTSLTVEVTSNGYKVGVGNSRRELFHGDWDDLQTLLMRFPHEWGLNEDGTIDLDGLVRPILAEMKIYMHQYDLSARQQVELATLGDYFYCSYTRELI